jgi:uncharacterized protein
MKVVRCIALILVVIGALNWGLWGFFQYDLIADLFVGPSSGLSRLIYSIVGLAGLYCISLFFGNCCCSKCRSGKPEEK